jgi:CheY-like chemotaxis protein
VVEMSGSELTERRARVLVIDNDPSIVKVVRLMLGSGVDVTASTDPQQALKDIGEGARFDLILCDLLMQPLTGANFHRLLLESAPELAPRTVFMTGGAYTASAQKFLCGLPNAWIDKPFPPLDDFRSLVQEHLRRLGRLPEERG